MAEIAVLHVICKIGIAVAGETLKFVKPLLANKAAAVVALPDDMMLIKNDLELIISFLKAFGRKGWQDDVIETWIQQVRRLAYDIEDIADQFIHIVGTQNHRSGSWWSCMKKIAKKPQYLFSLDEVATEVQRINKVLQRLKESGYYWTKSILDGETNAPAANYKSEQLLYLPGHDHSINHGDLLGIDKNKVDLIMSLDSEDDHLQIIAVWGMGGVGKSTLVNDVYRNEVSRFECHAWVSVSRSYKMDDILRNMLKEFDKEKKSFDVEKMDGVKLRERVKEILEKKRYLVILDDVWKAADFMEIRGVLVDNDLGSKVIITTRFDEVAANADDCHKIKVEPLDEQDAWLLFCKKAFPRTENHICPPELHECGLQIVAKCGGLPLALVSIGSILSLKTNSITEWRLFYDQLISELHTNENLNHVEKILNLSYKYLPSYLKNCFLYCAIFPEGHLIHRKKLIRLWIAEGFVEQKGRSSLEDVAEGYLTELVRRSMLQVVQRNSFDRIKSLRMHDFVRELAIFQSRNESFSTIYDDTNGVVEVVQDSRRVSVRQCNGDIRSSINPSRMRTFMAFDSSMEPSSWSFILSESKYLAVLDLSGLPIETIPSSIGQLFNLKYFCLNDTKVKELPQSITKLQNLVTLSLENAETLTFPQGFSKLKKLRNLLIWTLLDASYSEFNIWGAMEPFEGLWNLRELRSLNEVRASKAFVAKLAHLSQLRCLCISYVRSSHCAQLCHSFSKMRNLSRLHIRASDEHELLVLDDFTLQNPLQKLDLVGRLSQGTLTSPFFSTHGNSLLELVLAWCDLVESPLPHLSAFSNLTDLDLTRAYTGQELSFHEGWFQNLKKILLINLPHVNQIFIHEGALVSLEFLFVESLMELRDVPTGLQYVKYVKEAYFIGMHSDFVRNLRSQTEQLDHIPKVYLTEVDLLVQSEESDVLRSAGPE